MYIQLQNFGYNSSIKSTYHEGIYERSERMHQFPEIICVMAGSVKITVDGITETARAGDLAVITPFRAHSFHTPSYCKIWIGVISGDFVSDFISGENMYVSGEHAVFTPSQSLTNYVLEHFPDVYEDRTRVENDVRLYRSVKALAYAVFEEYTRVVPQTAARLKKNAIVSLLLYMSEHFTENITLSSSAAALGYTPTYLSHCIATLPNMSFRKLLNSLRVDYAKNLLISKDFKMIDIALECGFSSERTFYRAFESTTGMTPSEYKRINE